MGLVDAVVILFMGMLIMVVFWIKGKRTFALVMGLTVAGALFYISAVTGFAFILFTAFLAVCLSLIGWIQKTAN